MSSPAKPARKRKLWFGLTLGGSVLTGAVLLLVMSLGSPSHSNLPALSPDDLEQQKYDTQQTEREQQKDLRSICRPARRHSAPWTNSGALGVVSKVDRHWFLQFGAAIFLGVLDGLGGAAQRNADLFSATSVIFDRTSGNFDRFA